MLKVNAMDNIFESISNWIKEIILKTVRELKDIERENENDGFPELMDVETTCDFLGIKYNTFTNHYRYLAGFPKELPGKRWSKRAIKEWLTKQI